MLGPTGRTDFRSGPHAAVVGPGAPYAGGARNPSRTPTGVNGGFSLVKAESGVPTSTGAPSPGAAAATITPRDDEQPRLQQAS